MNHGELGTTWSDDERTVPSSDLFNIFVLTPERRLRSMWLVWCRSAFPPVLPPPGVSLPPCYVSASLNGGRMPTNVRKFLARPLLTF